MSVPPKRKSWAGPAAEGALVLAVVGMLFVAALAGFLVGRGSAEDHDSPAATETQATPLAAGSAVAYLVGPLFLGSLMPRYAEGLPALRPLLPGMTLLAT